MISDADSSSGLQSMCHCIYPTLELLTSHTFVHCSL